MNSKRGPKEKYSSEMCEQIINVAAEGGHLASMLVTMGIKSKDTFYRWCNEHPDFKEAYEYSKLVSQDAWERIGYKGATGQIPNFSASTYAIIMNNKFGDEYKRSGSGSHTEINLTNNTLTLSTDELKERIAATAARLKLLGDNVGSYGTIADTARIIDSSREEGTTS